MLPDWARAGGAALLLGVAYSYPGVPRMFAGAVLLYVLLTPGPQGKSMLAGLIEFTSDKLGGKS